MDENKFKTLMIKAKTFQEIEPERVEFWHSFQRGLRRLFHGENFSTDSDHDMRLNCRRGDFRAEMQLGYRTGFHHDSLNPENIRDFREKLGLSVKEIAEYCDVSQRTVEGWEQGRPINGPALKLLKMMIP